MLSPGLRRAAPVLAAAVLLGGCGGSSSQSSVGVAAGTSADAAGTSSSPAATTRTSATPPRPRHGRRSPDPGSLPQTNQLPSGATAAFHSEMDALWRGITTNSRGAALPAFFPQGAYRQVKAIADPGADYKTRLLGEYGLDIAAAHALLGSGARHARLLEVRVPSAYAHWVDPGACYNRVGYYELPNARVVYSEDGGMRSFGIASLISWRGVWYVVHLGAVVREVSGGVLDAPSAGAGTSLPSTTC